MLERITTDPDRMGGVPCIIEEAAVKIESSFQEDCVPVGVEAQELP